jgi:hypothetical protein
MPRVPKRFARTPTTPRRGVDALRNRGGGSNQMLSIPQWVLDSLLRLLQPRLSDQERRALLPRARASLVDLPHVLDLLERQSTSVQELLKVSGGKSALLAGVVKKQILQARSRCPKEILSAHAAVLQHRLDQLGPRSDRPGIRLWVEKQLPAVLEQLKGIPCGCLQRTAPPSLAVIQGAENYALERGHLHPTLTSLLYFFLAYHHGLQPETVRKRLVGQ